MRNNRIGYGKKSKDIKRYQFTNPVRDLPYGAALVPRQLPLP